MEINVLINFHEDWMQNVARRVLTSLNVDDGRRTPDGRRTKCDHNSSPCTSCIGELKIENLYNWLDNLWLKVESIVAKEKLLVLSNFFFCHYVFKKPSAAEASESVYKKALNLNGTEKSSQSERNGKKQSQCYEWVNALRADWNVSGEERNGAEREW